MNKNLAAIVFSLPFIFLWLTFTTGQPLFLAKFAPKQSPWSAGIIFQIFIFLSLLAGLIYCEKPQIKITHESKKHSKIFWFFLLFYFSLFFYCSNLSLLTAMNRVPIDSKYADMLPLMIDGFKDLMQWQTPYHPHQVPWTLTNYYLPGTFLPYYIGYLVGIDIRIVTIICINGILLGLLWLSLFQSDKTKYSLIKSCSVWSIVAMLIMAHVKPFLCNIHLGPLWMYSCLAFIFLIKQRYKISLIFLFLCLLSRESSLFTCAIPLFYLWFKNNLRLTFIGCIVFSTLILLPFILADPFFIRGNIQQYESLGWYLEQNKSRFFGFAGLLLEKNLLHLRWAFFCVVFLSICAVFVVLRKRIIDYHVPLFAAATAISFGLWALITWEYLFVEPMVILAPGVVFFINKIDKKRLT
ncbi:MAG: hypothetical protein WCQ99_03685 [Pseudomonadota bacterium]